MPFLWHLKRNFKSIVFFDSLNLPLIAKCRKMPFLWHLKRNFKSIVFFDSLNLPLIAKCQ